MNHYVCNDPRYTVDLPYPYPQRIMKNQNYAIFISGAFAGRGSEFTAIAQYTAHNFYTFYYPEIADAYRCIITVEQFHLNLLGNLIRDLGLPPVFLSYEDNQYWNGSYPAYAYEIKQILAYDIEGEKDAIAHYKRLIHQINDPGIQALLGRIILDEEKHIEILTAFFSNIRGM